MVTALEAYRRKDMRRGQKTPNREIQMIPVRDLLLVASLLMRSQASMAAFVSHDLHSSGDGLVTLDTATNLEWLDVTASLQRSYNDVVSQLGPGGNFQGSATPH
jgi:hypothetical protein